MPLPRTLVTDCVANNNGAGVLLPDNRTLVQMQPLYIPKAGGPIIAWYHTGAPQPFPWEIDILGDGALGAHGGSGLSSFGGAVRLGELLPGAPPIAHALKLELWAHAYYFVSERDVHALAAPSHALAAPSSDCPRSRRPFRVSFYVRRTAAV